MLASSGFFSDLVCPYFKSGLCERPHCHFKHELPPQKTAAPKYSHVSAYTPTPLHKLKKQPPKKESPSSTSSDPESRAIDAVPEYTPTPLSELKKLKEQKRKTESAEKGETKKPKKERLDSSDDDVQVVKTEKPEEIPFKSKSSTVSKNNDKVDAKETKTEAKVETSLGDVSRKARIAHQPSSGSKIVIKKKMTAADVMYNRYKALEKSTAIRSEPENPSKNDESQPTIGKKRIAHNVKTEAIKNATAKRPVMPIDVGPSTKIPLAIRKQYMNIFIDEFLKCCTDQQEAFDKGLKEEKLLYDKAPNRKLYSSLAANAIKRIRSEHGMQKPQLTNIGGNKVVSHEQILNGPRAANCSIEKKNKSLKAEELPEGVLYSFLQKYVLKPETMKTFGYPMKDPDKEGCAIIMSESKALNDFKKSTRICYRCKKNFVVNEQGVPIEKEPCNFHHGRLWNERSHGTVERKYSCCKMDMTAAGCCVADSHVVDGLGHPDFCKGYVCTKPKKLQPEACHGVYALDCEMCNTTVGMELTRVSVIDSQMELVYDTLVKPRNAILDYNTKFSGIKEEDLKGIKTRLENVQKDLLKLFSNATILIGHSLESDLKALKIIHPTVIDTAEVFPHRRGLPFKRALRTLAAEFLRKIIQDDVAGHDSHEDAKSCMQLMLMKINNDLIKVKPK